MKQTQKSKERLEFEREYLRHKLKEVDRWIEELKKAKRGRK